VWYERYSLWHDDWLLSKGKLPFCCVGDAAQSTPRIESSAIIILGQTTNAAI
jgi:hypothetical protein